MQLCALDKNGQLVRATAAERHLDYTCLECRQVVRLRKGVHRQAHYYHSQPNQACRLSGKGLVHISVQKRILELLPENQADMEVRFDTISRIADIAWIPEKIIFEIQCASITAQEIMERNASYASVGFDVVWILHSNRYNKMRVTSAEDVLKSSAHYFTDIDTLGGGSIFDQYSFIVRGKRLWRFPPTSIDITAPYICSENQLLLRKIAPARFLDRYRNWTRGFGNDYRDCCMKMLQGGSIERSLSECFCRLLNEDSLGPENPKLLDALLFYVKRWIVYPYQVVFRHLLEKASR